jgi:hypothetical protein
MKWGNFRLLMSMFLLAGTFVALVSWSNHLREKSIEVTALIYVERQPTNTVRLARVATNYQAVQRKVLAFLKSDAVLTQCVNDRAVRELPLLEENADPVAWLRDKLRIEPFDESDVIIVGMQTTAIEAEQIRILLLTLLNTFVRELGIEEHQFLRLQLQTLAAERDLLRAQVEYLELQSETDRSFQIATTLSHNKKRIELLNSELEYWRMRGCELPRARITQLPLASE